MCKKESRDAVTKTSVRIEDSSIKYKQSPLSFTNSHFPSLDQRNPKTTQLLFSHLFCQVMFLEIQEKNLLIEEHQFWLSDASPSVKNTCFLSFSLCSKMCTFFCWHDFSFFHNEIAYDYTDVLTLSNSFCSLLYNLVSGISWWCISALSKNDYAILGSFLGHDTWCFRVHLLFCLLIISVSSSTHHLTFIGRNELNQ